MSHLTAVLPAPRRRRAAGRARGRAGTCQGTCSPPHGSRSAGMVGVVVGYDRVATAAAGCKENQVPFGIDISPHHDTLPSSSPRLRQSSASWFVVEYGARALHYIDTVLGLASGAKETVWLSVGEARRSRSYQRWALFRRNPLVSQPRRNRKRVREHSPTLSALSFFPFAFPF